MPTTKTTRRGGMSFRTLGLFFALTFGLSWGVIVLYILFTAQIEAIFGELNYTNPVYILAVYGPAIVGVLLVWRYYGIKGLLSFFRRLTHLILCTESPKSGLTTESAHGSMTRRAQLLRSTTTGPPRRP